MTPTLKKFFVAVALIWFLIFIDMYIVVYLVVYTYTVIHIHIHTLIFIISICIDVYVSYTYIIHIYIVYGCNMSTGSMTCVAKLPVRRVTPADCSPSIRSSSVPNPKAETASNFAKLGVVSKVFSE